VAALFPLSRVRLLRPRRRGMGRREGGSYVRGRSHSRRGEIRLGMTCILAVTRGYVIVDCQKAINMPMFLLPPPARSAHTSRREDIERKEAHTCNYAPIDTQKHLDMMIPNHNSSPCTFPLHYASFRTPWNTRTHSHPTRNSNTENPYNESGLSSDF
jgi:hypothetical protein